MRTKGKVYTGYDSVNPITGREGYSVGTAGLTIAAVDSIKSSEDNAAHLAACWNAIESIAGDPAVVGEIVLSLVDSAKLPKPSQIA